MKSKESIGYEKIRFAVVGCGYIGKRHAGIISRNQHTQLTALCDILPREQTEIGYPDIPFFTSQEEMLSEIKDIDVVAICTPNGIHAAQAIKALEAGKHILVEKPMALKKTDCEELLHKALQMHRYVFCVMQNRYSPPSVWLKQIMETKPLGEIYMVQINCFWNRDERYYKGGWKGTNEMDGGVLFTQYSHFIDMMYWLFGDIKDIKSEFRNFSHKQNTEFDDSGIISFRFLKQGIGTLCFTTSVWDKNFESSITIIAEKGTIKAGGQYMDKIEYCHIKDYTLPQLPPTNPANNYGTYMGTANNHYMVIENVVNTLKNGSSTATNALEGMKVVEIIERIYAAK